MPRMHRGLREGVVPEEGVEERFVGMSGLGLLDAVLPTSAREVKVPEDLGFLEPGIIGPIRKDVRAETPMDQAIDLERPAERVPLSGIGLDQSCVGHAHARSDERR